MIITIFFLVAAFGTARLAWVMATDRLDPLDRLSIIAMLLGLSALMVYMAFT